MLDDLTFAIRRLKHSPGFAIVAVLTLAVVVGANTAILSVADAVLFRPLPFSEPERVHLLQIMNQSGNRSTRFDNAFIDAINEHHRGLSQVATFGSGPRLIVDTPEGAESVRSLAVSANYFDVLGVVAARGRTFAADDTPGRAALVTHQSWTTRFGADPTIVGRSVTLGSTTFDVVGILPSAFSFPTSTFFAGRPEVVTVQAPVSPGTAGGTFHPIVRLEPGVSREQAQAEMEAVLTDVRTKMPKLANQTPFLEDIRETIYPVGRDVMRFLFVAAMLVLLTGCANLANMLLARGRRLERDTAMRLALGAGRIRIVRPLLFEALLLGAAGSALALLVTTLGFDALMRQVPAAAYGSAQVGVDGRIVLAGLLLGLVGGLLFAIVPAWRSARLDVLTLMQGRHRGARGHWRLGRPMIAVQVALAIVLVFGAAIATRAFVDVLQTPLGFDPERVAVVQVAPPAGTTDVIGFYRQLVDRLSARSDVISVGASGTLPLSGSAGWDAITLPGSQERVATLVHVTPGFFETIGLQPEQGRTIEWDDAAVAGAVISEGAAQAIFGASAAVGRTIEASQGSFRVVGVVKAPTHSLDTSESGARLGSALERVVYVIPVGRTSLMTTVVKHRTGDESALRDLKRDIGAAVPGVPVTVDWWTRRIDALANVRDPRFQAMVLGSFAFIATGLSALGIFGIVSFLVTTRSREMGVRLAIGAEPGQLVRLMVRQAMVPVTLGLLVGLALSSPLARLAESRFVQFDTSSPVPLITAAVVVILASCVASLLPALRAARIDPTIVLKAE